MALMRSFLQRGQALLQDSLIPLLARTGLAATFWLSGQSKVEGLVLDILGGMPPELDVPHITRSAVALFATEYRLPFLMNVVTTSSSLSVFSLEVLSTRS